MKTPKVTPIRNIPVTVHECKQIAHISLLLREITPQWFEVCSFTAKPKEDMRMIDTAPTLTEAREIFKQEEQEITRRIERKRQGIPTPAQLSTLFSLHIPIDLDMTYGQAWDLISAALSEQANERRARTRQRQEVSAS